MRPASTAMPMPARSISARDASMSRAATAGDWVMPNASEQRLARSRSRYMMVSR